MPRSGWLRKGEALGGGVYLLLKSLCKSPNLKSGGIGRWKVELNHTPKSSQVLGAHLFTRELIQPSERPPWSIGSNATRSVASAKLQRSRLEYEVIAEIREEFERQVGRFALRERLRW